MVLKMIFQDIAKMSFLIFLCFMILGVEAGSKELIDLHREEKSNIELGLKRIIEKIPYLKYLGVCAVWLTPIYPSPGVDMGYDITDYREIDEIMGTMEDFEELKNKLHENGIKIILDIVPNHTSDKHEWFIKSVQKEEPYTDYYVWVDAKYVNGTRQVPNNWYGSIWKHYVGVNEIRQHYYLHQFFTQQPDLNFWNPLVCKDIKLDKGVDGFRMDAVPYIYERQDFLDSPILKDGTLEKIDYTQGLDEYGKTRFMAIETYLKFKYSKKFYGNETNPGAHFPLNSCFFAPKHLSAKEYIDRLTELFSNLPTGAWLSWIIGNYDSQRATSKFGLELIDGLHMIQLLLPTGTPVVYMGDELGMTNTYLRDDQRHYEALVPNRERGRTPFQ
ncbi:hypothetical protein AGLY_005647 [Aphis glycines]|uniref:alpha-glucosidase n=1 Tax=Aphis glycines TaxID=307491 RepID=A0A6G0TTT9_APHGL|nr:hypothetical protein AGLY_005647 [Aphis glycines]